MSEFQEWMRANAGALSAKPLSEVYLPGTHDSGAFKVDTDVILSDSQLEQVARSSASSFFGGMVKMWIETQEHDIAGQLDLGVRFLDFRLAPQNASQTSEPVIWISHTVACVQLTEALQQLDSWLNQHPSEVVLLRLTRDWEHRTYWTPEHAAKLWEVLSSTVGRYMLPSGARGASGAGGLLPTYNEVISCGKPLVVFWEMEVPASPVGEQVEASCYSGPGLTDTLWPEKANPDENLAGMIELVKQRQQQAGYTPGAPSPQSSDGGAAKSGWKLFSRYSYLSMAATPGMDTLSCLGNFGLKALAEKTEALLPQLLDLDLTGCPAITVDYPSEPVVRAILAQNKF